MLSKTQCNAFLILIKSVTFPMRSVAWMLWNHYARTRRPRRHPRFRTSSRPMPRRYRSSVASCPPSLPQPSQTSQMERLGLPLKLPAASAYRVICSCHSVPTCVILTPRNRDVTRKTPVSRVVCNSIRLSQCYSGTPNHRRRHLTILSTESPARTEFWNCPYQQLIIYKIPRALEMGRTPPQTRNHRRFAHV